MEFAAQLHQQNLWREGLFLDTSLRYWPAFFPSCTRSDRDGSWQCVRHHYQRFKEHENKAKGQEWLCFKEGESPAPGEFDLVITCQ